MASSALAGAREMLSVAGYGRDVIEADYPVWLGSEAGVATADLVAFGRTSPRDMSTAAIAVGQNSIERIYAIAQVIAAPYFFVASDRQVDLWVAKPEHPEVWQEAIGVNEIRELRSWLEPSAVLQTKVGLHQLPLFDLPVDLLAAAHSNSADRLSPLVAEALQAASEALPLPEQGTAPTGRMRHRAAARLVVGALTVLVMRDRGVERKAMRSLDVDALIERVVDEHSTTFIWWNHSSSAERSILSGLVEQLGNLIDYQSLDPAILSEVYEQALVDDDDRKDLGIHYTPPRLARRLLADLPVETVAPDDRHVLDPCCGSGTLLVAAHDRLRDLQPPNLDNPARHRDLAVHLHGYDADSFATEIARLTLLLHAQPAGNGWQIEEADALQQTQPAIAPKLIVTNPPWRFESEGHRTQAADALVHWSMEGVGPGGLLGILLPASWLSADNSATTRAELTEEFEVFETWRLPEGVFSTSTVATAVLLARKRDGTGGQGARLVREVTRAGVGRFFAGEPGGDVSWLAASNNELSEVAPRPAAHARVQSLETIARVLSGPQPLAGIVDRSHGVPYLNHLRDVRPYGTVPDHILWAVAFPEDFQGSRGASILDKKKVLASAAKSSASPWRFHVAIDRRGVAMRNSMRGIAPLDQDDDDLLFALAIIVGSAFASTWAATFGGDRNIPAGVLKNLPIPCDRGMLAELARFGRLAADAADAEAEPQAHLREAETIVWDAYGVSKRDRETAVVRFAGQRAPDGGVRYPARGSLPRHANSNLRRIGVVLDIDGSKALVWVNGLTPQEGIWVPFPAGMSGWLARPGATFDVTGVESTNDLGAGRFRLQPMAWQDLDLDSEVPEPIHPL